MEGGIQIRRSVQCLETKIITSRTMKRRIEKQINEISSQTCQLCKNICFQNYKTKFRDIRMN